MKSLSKKLFLYFCLCFGFVAVKAQYRFDSWTTDDGLPQNSVLSIVQTPDGYIWLTTLEGLVRFDGVRFTVFNKFNRKNLSTSRFVRLYAESSDTLWLATETSDLVRFHLGEFQTFSLDKDLPITDVLNARKEPDGNLLLATTNGSARLTADGRFSLDRETKLKEGKEYFAQSGARWEIDKRNLRKTENGQTVVYDSPFVENLENLTKYDSPNEFIRRMQLFEDHERALWLAAGGLLYRLKDGGFDRFGAYDGMTQNLVKTIAEDRDGAIWLGTEKDGACRFQNGKFSCYTTKEGLSSNNISSILLDREGTLWLGTNDGGINRLTKQVISTISTADGLADKNVYPLLPVADNEVWIGSFTALAHYKNGIVTENYKPRTELLDNGLLYNNVQALSMDKNGRLWIGAIGGVQRFENEKFTDFTNQLNLKIGETDFWDIHEDRRGWLWFATRNGLIKYADGTATRYTVADGLPDNNVNIIHEAPDGAFWIGTAGGLARLTVEPFAVESVFTGNESAPLTSIRAITQDADGTFWVGTYDNGIWRLKNGKLTNITIAEGLFSNGAFTIVEDDRGNFWMPSNQGIYRVSKQELNAFADGRIAAVKSTAFGKSDGMLNVECNGGRQPGAMKTADGKIWFPTQDGVAIINPEIVPFNPLAPPVVIESVKIDNVLAEPSAAEEKENRQFTIEASQRNLEIDYTALTFIKPEQAQFKYKLEGLDEDWTNAAKRREVFYPYLPPGEYTFRVIAANSDNVWNEQGAAIKIKVLPPFYRTSWFVGLTFFCLALIGVALYKWRVSELQRRQKSQEEFSRRLINAHEAERSRVAAELHDSIGQTLAMIKNRAAFGSQADDDRAAKEQLAAIQAQTTQAIGEVREISYNLRPYLLENLGLTRAVKSLVHKIEEVHLLTIEARIDDVDNLFAPEAEMSVYRIVQESLNNVAKHSEADTARLTIEKANNIVTIKIEDDGRGFDKNAQPKTDAQKGGFGLLGINERVRMLGGTLDIQTAIGKGTKLTIKIAIDK